MDGDFLTALLKGEHFDMEERVQKGLWPHPPLKYAEVLEHLTMVIQQQQWFPVEITSPREGVIVQNVGGEFICHCLAYGPFGNRRSKDDQHIAFKKAKDAADYYLKNDLGLPGDLDGWIVLE